MVVWGIMGIMLDITNGIWGMMDVTDGYNPRVIWELFPYCDVITVG